MRPEKWYTLWRTDRPRSRNPDGVRVRRPPIPPEPPRTPWHWLLTTTIPIVISVFALLISVRAYDDQHASDQAAAQAARQQYARLVSAWLVSTSERGEASIVIQNLGSAPVTEGTAFIVIPPRRDGVYVTLGDIPPCSTATATVAYRDLGLPSGAEGTASFMKARITFLMFEDVNGIWWDRSQDGRLVGASAGSTGNVPSVLSSSIKIETAKACS